MTKTALLARIPIKAEAKERFAAAMEEMFATVNEEEGTELYILNWCDDAPDTAYIYEVYTDSDALAAHAGSETMKNLMSLLGDLLDGAPELISLTPTAAKGIAL